MCDQATIATFRTSTREGTRMFTFCNPRKKNAFSYQRYIKLTEALNDAANDPTVCAVVKSITDPVTSRLSQGKEITLVQEPISAIQQ